MPFDATTVVSWPSGVPRRRFPRGQIIRHWLACPDYKRARNSHPLQTNHPLPPGAARVTIEPAPGRTLSRSTDSCFLPCRGVPGAALPTTPATILPLSGPNTRGGVFASLAQLAERRGPCSRGGSRFESSGMQSPTFMLVPTVDRTQSAGVTRRNGPRATTASTERIPWPVARTAPRDVRLGAQRISATSRGNAGPFR